MASRGKKAPSRRPSASRSSFRGSAVAAAGAQAVGWGLSRDEALKALTINAAEIFGVADRVGTLTPGKIANLFVAKGDPREVRTALTHVIIAGRDVPLE